MVNLVSGGLDSTLIGVLAKKEGVKTFPLFIDYGQRAAQMEWTACVNVHKALSLPEPVRMNISGFGQIIESGLTSEAKDVSVDAFTPGRNMMFILMGCSYAFQVNATSVSIGLLSEEQSIFPDQTSSFLNKAENAINEALGRVISVLAPLMEHSKHDVIQLAKEYGIVGTYSCHTGMGIPCGKCISCKEILTERRA